MRMHCLQTIELDVGRWNPPPNSKQAQRVLVGELRLFCPSLNLVMFWMGNTRSRWTWSGQQWHLHVDLQQLPQHSNIWCLV